MQLPKETLHIYYIFGYFRSGQGKNNVSVEVRTLKYG
jgi:hypothetical protein